MGEQLIKIIQIDGKMPRVFIWKNNTEAYKHSDEKASTPDLDNDGREITNLYPVWEVPVELAKVKISMSPNRYRLFGGKPLPYQVMLPNTRREWRTAEPVGFRMSTGPVYDKDGEQVKGKITKKWFLAELNGKDIKAVPYMKTVKEPEVKPEVKPEGDKVPEGDKKLEGQKQVK